VLSADVPFSRPPPRCRWWTLLRLFVCHAVGRSPSPSNREKGEEEGGGRGEASPLSYALHDPLTSQPYYTLFSRLLKPSFPVLMGFGSSTQMPIAAHCTSSFLTFLMAHGKGTGEEAEKAKAVQSENQHLSFSICVRVFDCALQCEANTRTHTYNLSRSSKVLCVRALVCAFLISAEKAGFFSDSGVVVGLLVSFSISFFFPASFSVFFTATAFSLFSLLSFLFSVVSLFGISRKQGPCSLFHRDYPGVSHSVERTYTQSAPQNYTHKGTPIHRQRQLFFFCCCFVVCLSGKEEGYSWSA
jgi:hypothetical protein